MPVSATAGAVVVTDVYTVGFGLLRTAAAIVDSNARHYLENITLEYLFRSSLQNWTVS